MKHKLLSRLNAAFLAIVVAFAQLTVLPVPQVAAEPGDAPAVLMCHRIAGGTIAFNVIDAELNSDHYGKHMVGPVGNKDFTIQNPYQADKNAWKSYDATLEASCAAQDPAGVTATAPTQNPVCGANNDTFTYPTIANIAYNPTGWTGGSNTVTASATGGYILRTTGFTSQTFVDNATDGCTGANVTGAVAFSEQCGPNDSYTINQVTGVTFYVNGVPFSGTYGSSISASGTVTITAATDSTHVLTGYPSGGWSKTFSSEDCTITIPEAPVVTDLCGLDNATWATGLASVPGQYSVQYSQDNRMLKLVATANYSFTGAGGGYVSPDGKTFTYTASGLATDADIKCATPTDKDFTVNDLCQRGNDTVTIKRATSQGVDYKVDYGENSAWTVTATPKAGYAFTNGEPLVTYSGSFTNKSCPLAPPAAPEFNDLCGTANDTFTLKATNHVTYSFGDKTGITSGTYSSGGATSVQVTATAEDNYEFAPGVTTKLYTLNFTNAACSSGQASWKDCKRISVTTSNYPSTARVFVTLVGYDSKTETEGPLAANKTLHIAVKEGVVKSFSYKVVDSMSPDLVYYKSDSYVSTCLQKVNVKHAVTFDDVCGMKKDSYSLANLAGVRYFVNGNKIPTAPGTYHAKGTVTVTAKALDGYTLDHYPKGGWSYEFTVKCVTICHATGSKTNPYETITTSASGAYNGHYDAGHHHGKDIIQPFMWDGKKYSQNWDTKGQAIMENDCAPVEKVTPAAPVVFLDACGVDDDYIRLTATEGVSYFIGKKKLTPGEDGLVKYTGGDTVTVTARAHHGYYFSHHATTQWKLKFTDEPCVSKIMVEVRCNPGNNGVIVEAVNLGEADGYITIGPDDTKVLVHASDMMTDEEIANGYAKVTYEYIFAAHGLTDMDQFVINDDTGALLYDAAEEELVCQGMGSVVIPNPPVASIVTVAAVTSAPAAMGALTLPDELPMTGVKENIKNPYMAILLGVFTYGALYFAGYRRREQN